MLTILSSDKRSLVFKELCGFLLAFYLYCARHSPSQTLVLLDDFFESAQH